MTYGTIFVYCNRQTFIILHNIQGPNLSILGSKTLVVSTLLKRRHFPSLRFPEFSVSSIFDVVYLIFRNDRMVLEFSLEIFNYSKHTINILVVYLHLDDYLFDCFGGSKQKFN